MNMEKLISAPSRSTINIRITQIEKEKIQRRAEQQNMTVSEFLRQVAIHGFAVSFDCAEIYELVKAITRIGVNISQIVAVATKTRDVSAQALRLMQIEHSRILYEINDVLSPDNMHDVLELCLGGDKYKLVLADEVNREVGDNGLR